MKDDRSQSRKNGGEREDDVLVDALADFMRPASQSTIRTRQTRGVGALSNKGASGAGAGGLTQKQLAALEVRRRMKISITNRENMC